MPLFLFATVLSAQTAKKYLLIEHFTNSWCSICKSKNPGFYTTIAPYAADIHHISIHPSTPYPQCIFYQANKDENQARANYYSVTGTPRVALNGTLLPPTSTLLPLTNLQTALAQKTAPISVKVSDVISGGNLRTTVQVKYDQALPTGNYVLHVMVAEKLINLKTPNQEEQHHDVFRDRLTPEAGYGLTSGTAGMTVETSYNVPLNAAWNAADLYVIAFVQNTATKEVLNSGSRFDVSVNTSDVAVQSLTLQPNPANERAWFSVDAPDTTAEVELYSVDGRQCTADISMQGNTGYIATQHLSEGLYVVKVKNGNRIYTGKLMVRH